MIDYKDNDFINYIAYIKHNCGIIDGIADLIPTTTRKYRNMESRLREAVHDILWYTELIIDERCGEEPENTAGEEKYPPHLPCDESDKQPND